MSYTKKQMENAVTAVMHWKFPHGMVDESLVRNYEDVVRKHLEIAAPILTGVDDHDFRLGEAFREIGLPEDTIRRAQKGHWSDFKSPLDGPKLELVEMLRRKGGEGVDGAGALAQRVMTGEFDG